MSIAQDVDSEIRLKIVNRWIFLLLGLGLSASLIYGLISGLKPCGTQTCAAAKSLMTAFSPETISSHISGMLVAPFISLGALALGVMSGFLFGLPRSLTSGEVREIARSNQADSSPTPTSAQVGYGVNTNLERISDWLTTIVVGLGLTNLGNLLAAIERYGDRTDVLFNFGGRAFGIGGGLYFLIFGFLLCYINTRTTLMLIFTGNDRLGRVLAQQAIDQAVTASGAALVVPTTTQVSAPGTPPAYKAVVPTESDRIVLQNVSLDAKQTPEEMLALANASARSDDYLKARVLYEDYIGRVSSISSLPDGVLLNYIGVLGLTGDPKAFENVLRQIAREDITAQAKPTFINAMRTALQANLYPTRKGNIDEAIRIGEALLAFDSTAMDAWTHLWLACAYGQKHGTLRASGADPVVVCNVEQLAINQVEQAIAIDATLKGYILTLYDPALVRLDDNDLVSLYKNDRMEALLRPTVAEPENSARPEATPAANEEAARAIEEEAQPGQSAEADPDAGTTRDGGEGGATNGDSPG